MNKEKLNELRSVLEWICTIRDIVKIPMVSAIVAVIYRILSYICSFFGNIDITSKESIISSIIVGIITAFVIIFYGRKLSNVNKKIKELNDRISSCKQVIESGNTKKRTPVQNYMIYKDVYDDFRTDLIILECVLAVELVKDENDPKKYAHKFSWKLVVKNPYTKPVNKAKFIYSGLKDKNVHTHVDVKKGEVKYYDKHTIRGDIKVIEDDQFMEIDFNKKLTRGKEITIYIDYTLKYDFNRNKDFIWLIPDALGFADMKKFRIIFYGDENIIRNTTKVELKSYKLNAEYDPERKGEIEYKELNGGKSGFEAKSGKQDVLHGYGYLLECTNDNE